MTTQDNNIDAHESEYLYKSTSQIPESGSGLFTAIKLYKDETIAVFTGDILSDEQSLVRIANGKDQYFISLLDGRIMDSMHTECFAKYANDAQGTLDSPFKNNAKIGIDEDNNVCIIATCNIPKGAEIFCSYGKRYWKKHR